MISQRQRALAGLLALVGASGGQVESRIRIQKEAFLLAAKGSESFDPEDFIFHYHGPYSRALSDLLHQSVSCGLIEETKEYFSDNKVRYSYRLTDAGNEFLGAEVDEAIATLAPKLHQCHWRALELAATVAFLERKKEVRGRKDAFAEALKIKPECNHYTNDAERVLQTVGI